MRKRKRNREPTAPKPAPNRWVMRIIANAIAAGIAGYVYEVAASFGRDVKTGAMRAYAHDRVGRWFGNLFASGDSDVAKPTAGPEDAAGQFRTDAAGTTTEPRHHGQHGGQHERG